MAEPTDSRLHDHTFGSHSLRVEIAADCLVVIRPSGPGSPIARMAAEGLDGVRVIATAPLDRRGVPRGGDSSSVGIATRSANVPCERGALSRFGLLGEPVVHGCVGCTE